MLSSLWDSSTRRGTRRCSSSTSIGNAPGCRTWFHTWSTCLCCTPWKTTYLSTLPYLRRWWHARRGGRAIANVPWASRIQVFTVCLHHGSPADLCYWSGGTTWSEGTDIDSSPVIDATLLYTNKQINLKFYSQNRRNNLKNTLITINMPQSNQRLSIQIKPKLRWNRKTAWLLTVLPGEKLV